VPSRNNGVCLLQKRIVPGTAVHYHETVERIERVVNGTDSCSSSEVETIHPSDDQAADPGLVATFYSQRTRHSSVPSEERDSDVAGKYAHARTPSSPAKLTSLACGEAPNVVGDSDSAGRTSDSAASETADDGSPDLGSSADSIVKREVASCDSDEGEDSENTDEMSESNDQEGGCVIS